MKALPDGQWATAEAHPSTGGAATVGDRQDVERSLRAANEQRIVAATRTPRGALLGEVGSDGHRSTWWPWSDG